MEKWLTTISTIQQYNNSYNSTISTIQQFRQFNNSNNPTIKQLKIEMIIREARREDCPRLLELVNELAAFEQAPEQVTVTLSEFEEAGFGEKRVWKAFVAETEGIIAGFALYYIRFSTWKGCRLYLEDFLVTQEMRGKGIGKLLFERIILEAKEKGFNGITWQVLDWNEPAIQFYKKYQSQVETGWLNASLTKGQVAAF